MINFTQMHYENKTYSRNTDPSVTKWGVEMFWFLFNFVNIIFLKEFFKFFVPAFSFNDRIPKKMFFNE